MLISEIFSQLRLKMQEFKILAFGLTTLQDLCVSEVVYAFDRYYLAFSQSDDPNLKRKFEFLQRVYSFEIATKLNRLDLLKTEYIDLLVNRYLKVLDTEWFRECPWKTVAAKFSEVGPNLQKVYFHKSNEELPWHDVIHHLPNLEKMSFQSECTDEIIKCVAQFCPNIVEIDISNCCGVTDESIKYLCMKENGKSVCPKLKELFISSSGIEIEGVKYLLKNLRSLEVIDYLDLPEVIYSLHENELSTLDKIEPYNLTALDLSHMYCVPYYTNLLKVCLTLCPRLKSLTCPVSSKEHLDLFCSSSFELENLHLECFANSKMNVTELIRLKGNKLKALTVSLCSIAVSVLAESCPCLKQLNLTQVNFLEDSITPTFHSLETCVFDFATYEPVTAKSISLLLKYSPKLEHIGFKRCDLSSKELKTEILRCCECCPIRKVNFSGSVVDMQFVRDILMNCRSLQSFKLDSCDLDSEDEMELYEFARVLPNNPEINFNDQLSFSDVEEDYLNGIYDFDDEYDDYDDYDDFYHFDGDGDDDDDDGDEDYGCYFEL